MELKKTIVLAVLLINILAFSQTIEVGTKETLYSKVLNEERTYKVYLPKHYNDNHFPNQQYPVIYILDGEKYFHVTSGIVKSLSYGFYPRIPECILVAIENTNRSRDLTPTKIKLPYENGKSASFELFIENELMPTIQKNYRTLKYKILIGHSFGGLFTLNTLLNNSNLFDAYIAIDPSLWWDNNFLLKKYQTEFSKITSNKRVFFANANSFNLVKKVNKQLTNHYESKNSFIDFFEKKEEKPFVLDVKFYESEDHGSVVLPSLIDGLKSVFNSFKINVRQLIKSPELLEKSYAQFSKKLGFEFKPQPFYIDEVVDIAIKKKQKKNAQVLYKLSLKLYPENIYLKNKKDE